MKIVDPEVMSFDSVMEMALKSKFLSEMRKPPTLTKARERFNSHQLGGSLLDSKYTDSNLLNAFYTMPIMKFDSKILTVNLKDV